MTFGGEVPFYVITATSDGTSASSATLSTFAQGAWTRVQDSQGQVREIRNAGDNQFVVTIHQWMKYSATVAAS